MALLACSPLFASLLASAPLVEDPPREVLELRGFRIEIEAALRAEDLGRAALELLSTRLYDIERAVPAEALAKLRTIPLVLDRAHPVAPCACYHPSPEWLRGNGHDPRLAKKVHFANAANFLEWTREQPWMVLHELAHGYYDQHLPDKSALVAAFERLEQGGRLESVLRWSGARERHYALSNPDEFFAEGTESWFGVNDYHPFVRAELVELDRDWAEAVRAAWGAGAR
jgi:hypothetical protein